MRSSIDDEPPIPPLPPPHVHQWVNTETGESDFPVGTTLRDSPYYRDPGVYNFVCRVCRERCQLVLEEKTDQS